MSNYLDSLKQTISSPGKQSAQNWVKIIIQSILPPLTPSLTSMTYVALPPIGASSHKKIVLFLRENIFQ